MYLILSTPRYMGMDMNEDERLQLCIQELSMMTGVVSKDIDYLLYLLLFIVAFCGFLTMSIDITLYFSIFFA